MEKVLREAANTRCLCMLREGALDLRGQGLLVHLRGSFGSEVKKGALDLLHR